MSTKQSKSTASKKTNEKPAKKEKVVAAAPAEQAAAPVPAPAPAKKAAAPKKEKAAAPAKKAAAAPKKAAAPAKKAGAKKTATKGAKKTAEKGPKKAAAPKKDKDVAAAATNADEEPEGNGKTRFFKVLIGDEETPHGRFSGTKPKQAANKALTSIFKSKEQSGGTVTGKVKFSIVECTRGSKHKKYHYVGERVQLKEPMKVTIGKGDNQKTIEYKFNNKVMKDKAVTA